MNNPPLALDNTGNTQQAAAQGDFAETFEHFGPDDDIDDAGFILQRRKDHAAGRAWTLATQHQTCDPGPACRL